MSILGIGLGAAGGLIQDARQKKQHKRQKELMDIQQKNQQQLNKQGHGLQKDMWDYTNYGNQVKHMKDAGLNVGLMYGMGGGGGSTAGSQGGGSAASGSAAAPMDIGNALQAGLMKAQIDNINADTDNKKGDTELKGTQGEGIQQQINESAARINEIGSKINLNDSKALTEESLQKLNNANTNLSEAKGEQIMLETTVTDRELQEMKRAGIYNITPEGAKMIKYYASEMGMTEQQVITVMGAAEGMQALGGIMNGIGRMFKGVGKKTPDMKTTRAPKTLSSKSPKGGGSEGGW